MVFLNGYVRPHENPHERHRNQKRDGDAGYREVKGVQQNLIGSRFQVNGRKIFQCEWNGLARKAGAKTHENDHRHRQPDEQQQKPRKTGGEHRDTLGQEPAPTFPGGHGRFSAASRLSYLFLPAGERDRVLNQSRGACRFGAKFCPPCRLGLVSCKSPACPGRICKPRFQAHKRKYGRYTSTTPVELPRTP